MSSELELLKQRITELEAENAKLKTENAEYVKLKAEITELEAEYSLKPRKLSF